MDLSIITVNYNSLSYLRECVASIYSWTRGISFEIIVVDNASPNQDIEQLAQEFPQVKIVKSDRNLGFAGANNLGFEHSTGDWILFLNPDTKLISPALTEALQEARQLPDAGIVGCRLLNSDLTVQTSSIMKFPGIMNSVLQLEYFRLRWPKLFGIGPLFSNDGRPTTVEAVSGACMFVKRAVFEKVMFCEEYFMYSEDLELCYRIAQSGLRNYYIGKIRIIHYGGTSSVREWQAAMKTKAELQFFRRNYGKAYTWAYSAALVPTAISRLAGVLVLRCFGDAVVSRDRLNSTRTRWIAVLKTVLGSELLPPAQFRSGAECRPTRA